MVKIVVTCNRCGKEESFKAVLTSRTEQTSPESVCYLDRPRDCTVLENIPGTWHHHFEFSEHIFLCDECNNALLEQSEALYKAASEAGRAYREFREDFFAPLCTEHEVTRVSGGYVATKIVLEG